MISFQWYSVKTMGLGSFSDLKIYYKCDRSEKNKHPALKAECLFFTAVTNSKIKCNLKCNLVTFCKENDQKLTN